jgi:hypothetical protein
MSAHLRHTLIVMAMAFIFYSCVGTAKNPHQFFR